MGLGGISLDTLEGTGDQLGWPVGHSSPKVLSNQAPGEVFGAQGPHLGVFHSFSPPRIEFFFQVSFQVVAKKSSFFPGCIRVPLRAP